MERLRFNGCRVVIARYRIYVARYANAVFSGYIDINIAAHLLPSFPPSTPRCSFSFTASNRLRIFLTPVYPPFALVKRNLAAGSSIIIQS